MTPTGSAAVPSITVVISTLARPQSLARCLDALLAGSRLPAEIVVVDQGDPAITAALLDARRDRGVPLVHVPQAGRGLSRSQNTGVEHASCPVVAIVDDDCVPDARWVEVAVREHDRAACPLLLGGRVLALPASGDRTVPLALRESTDRIVLSPNTPPWVVGTGGNFSVTRAAYMQVGGNDERLGTGSPGQAGNDLDLFHRIQCAGVRAQYEPDMVVFHERATPDEKRSRARTYGFGLGAAVASWLRAGDRSAWRVLLAWAVMRAKMLVRNPLSVAEQVRVLAGTAQGLAHGLLERRITPWDGVVD